MATDAPPDSSLQAPSGTKSSWVQLDRSARISTRRLRQGALVLACLIGLSWPTQPIIVALTANALKEDRQACNAAGMDGLLAKPVTLADLQRCLLEYSRSVCPA